MPYVMCDPIDFDDQILAFEREEDLKAYVKAQVEQKNLMQAEWRSPCTIDFTGISMESVSTRSCTKKEMRSEKLS